MNRLAAGVAVGGSLALALTACGSTGKSADSGPGGVKLTANEVLLKTSQKTATVGSFAADVTLNASGDGKTGTTHFTADVRLKPDIALSGTVDKASFGGVSLTSTVPVVFLNNVVYVKVPSQLSQFTQFTGNKPWIKFDLAKAGQQHGVDTASTIQEVAQLIDPGNLTKSFTGSTDAKKVGDESVDGTTTTHYTGTVTVKQALSGLDATTQAKLKDVYTKIGSQKIAFDLWADGQGLARKVTVKAATPKGEATNLTVVYSSFGKSVAVNAPAASQVGTINLPGAGN
jgi:carbon monoxide dehydrogenase subunit G